MTYANLLKIINLGLDIVEKKDNYSIKSPCEMVYQMEGYCMKKKILFSIIVIFMIIGFSMLGCVQKFDSEDDFRVDIIERGSAIEIIEYVGTNRNIRIPPQIRNLPVTHIGDDAFEEKNINSVTIPNSIISIGTSAFNNNQLTSITIPSSVTTIGYYAFMNNHLTNVNFPNNSNITNIVAHVFGSNELTRINIPNTVTHLSGFDGNHLISVEIPNRVTHIEPFAFNDNRLNNVNIPDSVISIGMCAFYGNQLTSITIPNSVRRIEIQAFMDNPLTSITIGENVSINTSARSDFISESEPFDNEFRIFYNNNGRRAGTYIFRNGNWLLN